MNSLHKVMHYRRIPKTLMFPFFLAVKEEVRWRLAAAQDTLSSEAEMQSCGVWFAGSATRAALSENCGPGIRRAGWAAVQLLSYVKARRLTASANRSFCPR